LLLVVVEEVEEVMVPITLPLMVLEVVEQEELQFVYIPQHNSLLQHILLVVEELQEVMLVEMVEPVEIQHLRLLAVEQV
jgi:hypothetical protein